MNGQLALEMTSELEDTGSFIITEEHGAIPLFGHEVKWRVSHNEVPYVDLVRFAEVNNLDTALVPGPRCGWVAFALATKVFATRRKTEVSDDSWDNSICSESWSIRTLRKGNEYVLIRERLGRRTNQRELEQTPIYRILYIEDPGGISAEEWRRRFMLRTQGIEQQQVGETDDGTPIMEPVEPANPEVLRTRVRITPYNVDEGILDSEDHFERIQQLQERFVTLCSSVDEIQMRAKLRTILKAHNAVPDITVKGGLHSIANQKKAEELEEGEKQPHIATLDPFGLLLRYWGNTNRPNPTSKDAVWSDEEGKRVDYRMKGDIRLTPLVETDEVLNLMADNLEHGFNIKFGELYEQIRTLLNDLKTTNLTVGGKVKQKDVDARQKQLKVMAEGFQKTSKKLFDGVKEFEEMLDRKLTIRTTPYKDQMSDMDARLAVIKSIDEQTADRFMKLVTKGSDEKSGSFIG